MDMAPETKEIFSNSQVNGKIVSQSVSGLSYIVILENSNTKQYVALRLTKI